VQRGGNGVNPSGVSTRLILSGGFGYDYRFGTVSLPQIFPPASFLSALNRQFPMPCTPVAV
jgi:hypothetical protein